MSLTILVTGGAGYIGTHTAVALAEAGFRVVLLDNFSNSEFSAVQALRSLVDQEVPFYEADCRNKSDLLRVFNTEKEQGHPISGVIHFAALKAVGESVEKPELYKSNNIGGTECLLEIMNEFGVNSLVFSSSCTVYGEPENIPVDELSPFLPSESPYGYTKQACEKLIVNHADENAEFSSALLRYFNPIGAHPSAVIGEAPRGIPNNLIPFLCQAVAKLRGPLTVFGTDYPTNDGSCIRDYLHVMDLAEAHVKAIGYLFETGKGKGCRAFNLGTGIGVSVLEVIDAFEKVTGEKVPHKLGDRRVGDVVAIWANANRAKEELKWETKRSLEQGLNDAWNWQQKLSENSGL
jgi:UDP-glucose 4-epimerase